MSPVDLPSLTWKMFSCGRNLVFLENIQSIDKLDCSGWKYLNNDKNLFKFHIKDTRMTSMKLF